MTTDTTIDPATRTSGEIRFGQQDEEPERKPRFWRVLVVFLAVAVTALALLLILWIPMKATKDTLPYELAKICMQVLGVAVLGGAVTFATSTFQQDREAHRKQLADEAERKRLRAEEVERRERETAEKLAAEVRATADEALERQREQFEITSRLMKDATQCAQAMYVTCQHVRRVASDSLQHGAMPPDKSMTSAFTRLHERYLVFNAQARAIQDELGARFGGRKMRVEDPGSNAFFRWHQIYDLLTAYYFQLAVKNPADAFQRNSLNFEGYYHSGLDLVKLARELQPRDFRRTIRSEFESAMNEFTAALLADAASALDVGSSSPPATIPPAPAEAGGI